MQAYLGYDSVDADMDLDAGTLLRTKAHTPAQMSVALYGVLTPAGRPFSPDNDSAVREICGDIGAVHPPKTYASYPEARVYIVWHFDAAGHKVAHAYAAVRHVALQDNNRAAFVIDAFGVHAAARRGGVGRLLYAAIENDALGPWRVQAVPPTVRQLNIVVESTYDPDSYARLVATHTSVRRDGVACVDLVAVASGVEGSCGFWRRIGLDHCQMYIHDSASILYPSLVLWKTLTP